MEKFSSKCKSNVSVTFYSLRSISDESGMSIFLREMERTRTLREQIREKMFISY